MGTISKNTFKRLFLLYTIGKFKNGCFGLLRLNKIVYLASRKLSSLIPFQYKHDHYGQHSEELDSINEQLLSMNYTRAAPLDSGKGNKYALADKRTTNYYKIVMCRIDPKMSRVIDEVVKDFGYLPEDELKKKAYCDDIFIKSEEGGILLEEKLQERIKVGLSEDDCEDLELSLDPGFIDAMRHL